MARKSIGAWGRTGDSREPLRETSRESVMLILVGTE